MAAVAAVKKELKLKKKPVEKGPPVVYACPRCRYQTVNRRCFIQHMSTHGVSDPFNGIPTPVAVTVVAPVVVSSMTGSSGVPQTFIVVNDNNQQISRGN